MSCSATSEGVFPRTAQRVLQFALRHRQRQRLGAVVIKLNNGAGVRPGAFKNGAGSWILRYQCVKNGWLDARPIGGLGLDPLLCAGVSLFREDIGDGEWIISKELA